MRMTREERALVNSKEIKRVQNEYIEHLMNEMGRKATVSTMGMETG